MKKPIPFGKYLLLERINVGGMAEVFKAKSFGVEGFERLVAVKRILPSIAEDKEFITMFIDEAKIAALLTHANIAHVFDLGIVGDSYYIAMEYVQGKDLRTIFDRARKRGEPIPVPMACFVMMKVCEGLDYAHNKKDTSGRDLHIVHRDVSPQNVLVSYDGEVKIVDFGIAKAASKAGKTQAGILKGKFGYMSPEQVRGLPLDRRSDVFSVGIVLYELLTGERLFVGESDFSTLEKVRNVEIMPPSTYNRRIPEELEQIVLKALARDPDDRYQTALDLHDDLQSFMYTSGNFFAPKDLAAYMRKAFADEIAKESARDEQYRKLDMSAAGFEAAPDAQADRATPGPPPPRPTPPASGPSAGASGSLPAGGSAGPTAPPPRRGKVTMLGVGAPPPPPPPQARASGPSPAVPMSPATSAVVARTSLPDVAAASTSRPATPAAVPAVGAAPPAAAIAPPPAAIEMDWDDEELSTQIYDKPEGTLSSSPGTMPSVAVAPAVEPAPMPRAAAPFLGAAVPTASASAAPAPVGVLPAPVPGAAGLVIAPPPSVARPTPPIAPTPQPISSSALGAPSPFDLPARREPTATTAIERGARASRTRPAWPLWVAVGALVVGGGAAAIWFLFLQKSPGTIHLTTVPVDPVVVFDERPVPALSSPFVIPNVEPGSMHLLEIRKPGFRTWSMQVEVQPGQTLVLPTVVLEPERGGSAGTSSPAAGTGFRLDSTPSGARVLVDGRELPQRTPVVVTDLTPGTYTIRVEHGSRYTPWQTQVQIAAGQVVELPRAELAQRSASVRFVSDPPGARVALLRGSERRIVGTTPTSADVELTGDAWTVEMSLAQHETWTGTLSIPPGREEHEVRAGLVRLAAGTGAGVRALGGGRGTGPRGAGDRTETGTGTQVAEVTNPSEESGGGMGTLRVNTRPWSQVFVDGELIGNTPQMNIPLRAGRHRVTFVNSDFNIRETREVTIRAGQTETLVLTLTPGGG